MRAHLLLTALLLSAHLFHTEARLAQGRHGHGRGRVEAGTNTGANRDDAWDRRRLLQGPSSPSPSPPALSTASIVGIAVLSLTVLVGGGVLGGVAIKMYRENRKRRAEEAAVEAVAAAARAQAAADRAARAAAAAKVEESRARLAAKGYADFLTRLEESTPGQGKIDGAVVLEYVPPKNAAELKDSVSKKLAAVPKQRLTSEEQEYVDGIQLGVEEYKALCGQLVQALQEAPDQDRFRDVTKRAIATYNKLYALSDAPSKFVANGPLVLAELEGVVKQADDQGVRANKDAKQAVRDASLGAKAAEEEARVEESKWGMLESVRQLSAGEPGVFFASKSKLAAKLREQQPAVSYEEVAPALIRMSLHDALNEGAGKSEARASQAEAIHEIGDSIVESINSIISGQEISFQSNSEDVFPADWDLERMAQYEADRSTPETKALEETVKKLNEQINELQREESANIKAVLAAKQDIDRAAKAGNKAAQDKAEKEKERLEAEQEANKRKQDELAKKRKEVRDRSEYSG